MRRKEIDRDEYEAIRRELSDVTETIGTVTATKGTREDLGATVLIRQGGCFYVDADEVLFARAKLSLCQRLNDSAETLVPYGTYFLSWVKTSPSGMKATAWKDTLRV